MVLNPVSSVCVCVCVANFRVVTFFNKFLHQLTKSSKEVLIISFEVN